MAKKTQTRYVCIECGYMSLSPLGKCPSCGNWGTVEEEVIEESKGGVAKKKVALSASGILDLKPPKRLSSGIDELDRVLGGGWIGGGVVLLGGQPGIGKSTLLLQACGYLADRGHKVLYISGEESASQVALRAKRLCADIEGLDLFCDSDIDDALNSLDGHDMVVVDSVQALRTSEETSWAGTPTQVRAVAQRCIERAKSEEIPMVLVGHITKEGRIAGPMLLEHMVDTVLMFYGESSSSYRLLRAEKNRYGGTEEVGIFEMAHDGLRGVEDPSGLYWNRGDFAVSGVAMTAIMEGSRPLMAEIQALASSTSFPYPRRTAGGINSNKLHLLLAVLQKRCSVMSNGMDVYVNVAGGLKLSDPGSDLALAMALASSVKDISLPPDWCFVAEIGLAGELRPVSRTAQRLKEARRLGFTTAVVSAREKEDLPSDMTIIKAKSLYEALDRSEKGR